MSKKDDKKREDYAGYVPINRKLFIHMLWKEERTFSKAEAWIDLIQSARFEDSTATELIGGVVVSWTRGQLPASLRYLAERWKWDKNKVDRFLKFLEDQNMIMRIVKNGQTIIELTNFSVHNQKGQKTGQGSGQQNASQDRISKDEQDSKRDSERDTSGTAAGQGRDKTNNVNKENKENNNSCADAHPPPKSFKDFTGQDFLNEVTRFRDKYPYEMLNAFYKYWKEKNARGKMKFQLEKTWETELRLENWKRRQEDFELKKSRNGTHSTNTQQTGRTFAPDSL